MALQSLLDALTRRTTDEVAALRRAAQAEAAAILQVVDQRAAVQRTIALDKRERALRDQAERAVVAARREARRMELEARELLLQRVLAAVRDRLAAMGRDPDLRAAAPAKLAAAFTGLGDLAATLYCAEGLADVLRPLAARRQHVRVQVDPTMQAGFRLASVDGHVSIDASLDGHLERERQAVLLKALGALARIA